MLTKFGRLIPNRLVPVMARVVAVVFVLSLPIVLAALTADRPDSPGHGGERHAARRAAVPTPFRSDKLPGTTDPPASGGLGTDGPQEAGTTPRTVVALRASALREAPGARARTVCRLPASAKATLLETRAGAGLLKTHDGSRGWTEVRDVLVLDDPAVRAEQLLAHARLLAGQRDRPVLALAVLSEVVRREPRSFEAWALLGTVAEELAEASQPREDGAVPVSVRLAGGWGVSLLPNPGGRGFRYDGDAWRRVMALNPPAGLAEEARLHLLTRSGPRFELATADEAARIGRERELAEFLESFPASTKRPAFVLERARILASLAESRARNAQLAKPGDGSAARVSAEFREQALAAASEIASSTSDPGRRRAADRLVARLTKSLPKSPVSESVVVSPFGVRAAFVWQDPRGVEPGQGVVLTVSRPDGRPLIQPLSVQGPDPQTLAFDPTGNRLVWDESPSAGLRRTRLLELGTARLLEPAAGAEPEILFVSRESRTATVADRYTTFVGFSPDGAELLVAAEAFTVNDVRLPRRHLLCQSDSKRPPRVVERPFSGPGRVDWERLSATSAVAETPGPVEALEPGVS